MLKCVGVSSELNQRRGVVSHGLDVEVEQIDGLVHQEDDGHQSTATAEAELADSSDAVLDPGEDGDRGDNGDGPDDDHLGARPLGYVGVHEVQALVDLDRADSKTGADSPDCRQNGHNINLHNAGLF